jgi:23S rRNA pseudouridine1911/1915/1917 synthase
MTGAPTSFDRVPLLYADADLVVVDKPAGMVVHPTYKNASDTLLDLLRQELPDPPSIVGRLDRFTSGIVVVARNGALHADLQRQMTSPDCRKDYLAIVHGRVEAHVEIDLRLRVDVRDRRRMVASANAGAPSRTLVEPIATSSIEGHLVSLLRCRLATGRRHQIRIHLASHGWPVVGDRVYGDRAMDAAIGAAGVDVQACPRQALHAWRLRMTQPVSRRALDIMAPVPADLDALVRIFGNGHLEAAS